MASLARASWAEFVGPAGKKLFWLPDDRLKFQTWGPLGRLSGRGGIRGLPRWL